MVKTLEYSSGPGWQGKVPSAPESIFLQWMIDEIDPRIEHSMSLKFVPKHYSIEGKSITPSLAFPRRRREGTWRPPVKISTGDGGIS